jgi:hypothetical protein
LILARRSATAALPPRHLPLAVAEPARDGLAKVAPGEEPAENLRAAEVRFARFFNQTPMAIAALDRIRAERAAVSGG